MRVAIIVALVGVVASFHVPRVARVGEMRGLSSQQKGRTPLFAVSLGTGLPSEGPQCGGFEARKVQLQNQLSVVKRDVVNVLTGVVLPFLLQVAFVFVLSQIGALPAFAKGKKRKGKGPRKGAALKAAAAVVESKATTEAAGQVASEMASEVAAEVVVKSSKRPLIPKKYSRVVKRLLEGANADTSNYKMKAGDTRTEIAALLNSFSSIIILGALTFGAYLKHKQREIGQSRALKRELNRVTEYKENMYFEAVQDILEKLAEPKLKGSQKASLTRQLKDLDPDGVIRKFLEEKGERPDISHLVNRRQPKKKQKNGTLRDRPKKKRKKKEERMDFTDDGDDEKEEEKAPPAPAPAPAPAPRPAPSSPSTPYESLLSELDKSLSGVISPGGRQVVGKYLRSRLEGIQDEAKQQNAMSKIAARLGDEEYWKDFAAKLE